nr:integrase, catalytic region, zinc finger, CCHC-type, peptidase aspartic, catalytic [Tanacetum cinerariifolium]
EIIILKGDQTLHKFKEGDFPRLNLRDILFLLVQKKLSNLEKDVIFDMNVALRMFTRRIDLLLTFLKDWNNPEGHEYPFDLSKPLPLIEAQGRQVVPADYFFNNDLESKSRISDGLNQFLRCLNEEMVADLRYFNSLESEDLKAQLQDKGIVIRVILTTNVSIPQLKSNPQGDRVMHNNSQGKKQEVEDHHRSVKLSKNKTSITTCNDNLNAKTLNVKSVVEIVLFIIDSGFSKHMTGNLKLLINFVEKILGTVKFGNDQIEPILRYGDLVQGDEVNVFYS